MKKIKRKLHSKEQLDEIIVGIAKAIMGSKAKVLSKAMENDPELRDAFMKHADQTARFREFLDNAFGEKTPEDLANTLTKANDSLDSELDRLRKRKRG